MPSWTGYKLITAATVEPVSMDDARIQCALGDSSVFDSELDMYITAARDRVETITARRLVTQTWDVFYPCLMDPIVLPFGNLQEVTEFEYTDSAGTTVAFTITGDDVLSGSQVIANVETNNGEPSSTGRIRLAYSQQWPSVTFATSRPVRIRAVFGWERENIPPALLQANRLLIGDWFRNREATKDTPMFESPNGLASLVSDYVVYA